jgi:2-polyprenyl-3-methyl-5-hydroxy-6-metoxy-1,4-benzoquinol methylase
MGRRQRRPDGRPGVASDFVEMAHRRVFGTSPGILARRRYVGLLAEKGRLGVLNRMLTDPAHTERVVAETTSEPGLSDEAFVDRAYWTLMGRAPDPGGLATLLEVLAEGAPRADVVRRVVRSEEYREHALPQYFPLEDLRALRPEAYFERRNEEPGTWVLFQAKSPDDFDWLEAAILEGGYYDRPGVWRLAIETDKRLMAELVASLEPSKVLELGCSSGAVLQCLHDLGVNAEGVEISSAAIESAFPAVQGRIHQVNATEFELSSTYDVIFGLDIFEHLNPNRLGECLKRVEAHLAAGGFVFANIPAFGPDPVFGEVFGVYIDEWRADGDRGENYRTLHCDDLGYPLNGHLIWGRSDWWVSQFEGAGLRREPEVEAALHSRYDEYLARATPARRSFYIFSKGAEPAEVRRLAAAIRATGSAVLKELS